MRRVPPPDGHGPPGPVRQLAGDGLVRTATRAAVRQAGAHPWMVAAVAVAVVAAGGLAVGALLVAVSIAPPADAAPLSRVAPALTPVVLGAYLEASAQAGQRHPGCAVRPAVVAAIGAVESGHGTAGGASVDPVTGTVSPPILGPLLDGSLAGTRPVSDSDGGRLDGNRSWDRAVGPMQFLPSTWARFGTDGDGDGTAEPHNIYDAAAATVAHLCRAPGPPADLDASPAALRDALLAYNASRVYADRVAALAATYELVLSLDHDPVAGVDGAQLVADPNVTGSPWALEDLAAGRLDPRAVELVATLARRWSVHISTVITGHSQCVGGGSRHTRPGCRVSHHWYGRAVDISAVDGRPVSASNDAALEAVAWLATLPVDSPLRPSEVGSPWPAFDALPGFFHDDAHRDHLHLGWRENHSDFIR